MHSSDPRALYHVLEGMKETIKKFGMIPPKIIYIDNCCKDKDVYERAFPSLLEGVSKLPLAILQNETVDLITMESQVLEAVSKVYSTLKLPIYEYLFSLSFLNGF